MTKENLHEGHRERMIERLLKSPESFSDHEIMEVILYSIVPRIDTNPLAHRILNLSGGLSKVFELSPEQIKVLCDVSDKVATHIFIMGKLIKECSIRVEKESKNKNLSFSFDAMRDELIDFFKSENEEKFVIRFLDGKYNFINQTEYFDDKIKEVNGDIKEIVRAMSIKNAKYAVIAHNHPSGSIKPSDTDDLATYKMSVVCSLSGVKLVDHIIIAGNNAFSYHVSGRLDKIKEQADISKMFSAFKEIDSYE